MEVFVICHDQDIILKYEAEGKFNNIPMYRYLFVGMRDCDKIRNNDKIIICRELPDNIEIEKNLVSYTAWYAVVKNNLIRTEHVAMLEYDVDLSNDFYDKHIEHFKQIPNSIVGYKVYPLKNGIFLDATPLLRPALKICNIDIDLFIDEYLSIGGKDSWTSSSNHTMSKDFIYRFVEWFNPIADYVKNYPLGAHVHERVIKVFCIMNSLKNYYIPDVLEHHQDKSHNIEALV